MPQRANINLCFWIGLLSKLSNIDFQYAFKINKPNIDKFINILQENNTNTEFVLWQNELLSSNELKENFIHVKEFNKNTINQGYLCSSCDPFLLLITYLFHIELVHQYCGHSIIYTVKNPRKTVNYYSNSHHFW